MAKQNSYNPHDPKHLPKYQKAAKHLPHVSIYLGGIFSLVGILLKKLNRKDKIPFAPFISISAYFVTLFGSQNIWNLFSRLYISP